jgi:hypothetical protein
LEGCGTVVECRADVVNGRDGEVCEEVRKGHPKYAIIVIDLMMELFLEFLSPSPILIRPFPIPLECAPRITQFNQSFSLSNLTIEDGVCMTKYQTLLGLGIGFVILGEGVFLS